MKYKFGPPLIFLLALLSLSLVVGFVFILVVTPDVDFLIRYGIKKEQAIALLVMPAMVFLLLLPLLYVRSNRYKGPWSKHQREPMLRKEGKDEPLLIYKGKQAVVKVDRRNKPKPTNANNDEDTKGGKDGKSRSET